MSDDDLAQTIPVLASLDLGETAGFYRDQLGFQVESFGDYLIAKRDRMEIHFWLAGDRIHPENTSCYIPVGRSPRYTRSFAPGRSRSCPSSRSGRGT